MLKNKWFYSSIFIILFPIFLFVNLQNNTENSSNQSTNLDEVSNQEMEKVIELNPDIMPMRIALANRYFEALIIRVPYPTSCMLLKILMT